MLRTRDKTCARCCHSGHPARNFERGTGPCLQNADVTKPHYRGGCAAYRKGVLTHRPRWGLPRLLHGAGAGCQSPNSTDSTVCSHHSATPTSASRNSPRKKRGATKPSARGNKSANCRGLGIMFVLWAWGSRLYVRLMQSLNFKHRTKIGGHPRRHRRLTVRPARRRLLGYPGLPTKVGLLPPQRLQGCGEILGAHGCIGDRCFHDASVNHTSSLITIRMKTYSYLT